jgi:hypothetical protein
MEERAKTRVAFSPMQILAASSILILIGVIIWQTGKVFIVGGETLAANETPLAEEAATPYESVDWQTPITDETGAILTALGEPDQDGISNIAGNVVGTLLYSYNALNENGAYTPEEGEKIAGDIAASLRADVSYKIYAPEDIETDADTSYERMLAYRKDLQVALEPLLGNKGYELSIFANYIDTADQKYVSELKTIAQNYRAALDKAAQVVVPQDAAAQHISILNALSQFSTTIERMSQHADDAFAAAALLSTYQNSETNLFLSFNQLASYYTSKQP